MKPQVQPLEESATLQHRQALDELLKRRLLALSREQIKRYLVHVEQLLIVEALPSTQHLLTHFTEHLGVPLFERRRLMIRQYLVLPVHKQALQIHLREGRLYEVRVQVHMLQVVEDQFEVLVRCIVCQDGEVEVLELLPARLLGHLGARQLHVELQLLVVFADFYVAVQKVAARFAEVVHAVYAFQGGQGLLALGADHLEAAA